MNGAGCTYTLTLGPADAVAEAPPTAPAALVACAAAAVTVAMDGSGATVVYDGMDAQPVNDHASLEVVLVATGEADSV